MNTTPLENALRSNNQRSNDQHMVKLFHNHGNSLNKQYVKLACGHKFSTGARQHPRGGCKQCWQAYFQSNPDIAHAVGMVLDSPDSSWKAAMQASQGTEFMKQAKSFHQAHPLPQQVPVPEEK